MRLDVFVKLKYELVLDILCVTYFLTSVTVPYLQNIDCVRYGK